MRNLLRTVVVVLLTLTSFAAAGAPLRIQDPAKFCEDLFVNLSQFKSAELANAIATTVGRPDGGAEIEKALNVLDGKKIDYAKKVVDREFGGALGKSSTMSISTISTSFIFRFNFKMTSTGWILANFNFKNETHDLFPKDFSER